MSIVGGLLVLAGTFLSTLGQFAKEKENAALQTQDREHLARYHTAKYVEWRHFLIQHGRGREWRDSF